MAASYSTDGGHTWITFPGTEGTNFRHMDWVNDNCGWAGSCNLSDTEGGVIKYVGDFLTSSASNNSFSNIKTLSVFPNPFSDQTTINFNIPQAGPVLFSVFDLSGKVCERFVLDRQSQGIHKINLKTEGLPAIGSLAILFPD